MNYIPGSRSTDDTCNYLHGSISARMAGKWSHVLIECFGSMIDLEASAASWYACMLAPYIRFANPSQKCIRRACRSLQLAYIYIDRSNPPSASASSIAR